MSTKPGSTAICAFGVGLALAACGAMPSAVHDIAPASVTPSTLQMAAPASLGISDSLALRLDSVILAAIADRTTPGAAIAVGRHGRLAHLRGYGRTNWGPPTWNVTDSTIYDLASLTKVVATTTAAMILEEDSLLELDRPVRDYLPPFSDPAKADITVRMLLTHRSGLKSFHPLYKSYHGRAEYLEQINLRPGKWAPGTQTDYTDWNLILVQLVVEAISGQALDEFLQERVFSPLRMADTGYRPAEGLKPRIAPTEFDSARGALVWGVVHDENAAAMGGVSGHAGLFSSIRDLAVFAQMLLGGGEVLGVRIVRPETVARWTAPQAPGASRALGWDKPSPESSAGRLLSPWSFGHTGFTGTSIWIDPHADMFVILLTNRVNPSRDNPRIGPLRRAVADVVRGAVRDMPTHPWEADYRRR